MSATTPPAVVRIYRVTIDVEAALAGGPSAELRGWPGAVDHHRALLERLLARPEVVDRLLRDAAVAEASRAVARLAAESWPGAEELLSPLVAELDAAARRYFAEGLEDGVSALYFDGVTASATAVRTANAGEA